MLDLLGDFGGFNDAIYFLLSIPMGFYSSSMYAKHIASLFKARKSKGSKKVKGLQDALKGVVSGEN